MTMENMTIKAKWLLGHPQFKGEQDVEVTIRDGFAYYKGEQLRLSRKGRQCLREDIRNA